MKAKDRCAALERVQRIRRDNVRLLISHYHSGGPRQDGRSRLAALLGVTAAYITHIAGPNPVRSIGEHFAREVETTLNLPSMWLDMLHAPPAD